MLFYSYHSSWWFQIWIDYLQSVLGICSGKQKSQMDKLKMWRCFNEVITFSLFFLFWDFINFVRKGIWKVEVQTQSISMVSYESNCSHWICMMSSFCPFNLVLQLSSFLAFLVPQSTASLTSYMLWWLGRCDIKRKCTKLRRNTGWCGFK